MSICFVLAPGESLSATVAERVRGCGTVIAVGNAYELAPWADALVANDRIWWDEHPAAMDFAGRKFCPKTISGIERHRGKGVAGDANSGMLGIDVALEVFKGDPIILVGFDFHGTHFFGAYTNRCSNTTPVSRQKHQRQMRVWRMLHPKARVVNCTPGSALKAFPMGSLDAFLPAERLVA